MTGESGYGRIILLISINYAPSGLDVNELANPPAGAGGYLHQATFVAV